MVRPVSTDQLVATDSQYLLHPLHSSTHRARVLVRGQGSVMWDVDGREYIDGLSGLWNVNVGHGRVELADAAQRQMSTLAFCSSYNGQSNLPAIELAERLSRLAYPNLNTTFFTSGGAESNESAFKTARYVWKRRGKPAKVKIISRRHGYHGVTMAAMSATGLPPYHTMFGPLVPNFIQIDGPYLYRCPNGVDPVTWAPATGEALEKQILEEGSDTVAAFIAEPVMGAGGVVVPTAGYFKQIRAVCDKYDILFIADEVITGFGRTGRFFALERWGVQPDIMSFAKGITSGYIPLGGIMVSDEIADLIRGGSGGATWMHAYTYSAHPTACAVGLANLDIVARERLVEKSADTGAYLLSRLKDLEQLPNVDGARGLGMMAAIEIVDDKATKTGFPAERGVSARAIALAAEKGLITRQRHYGAGESIMLAPPLTTTRDQVDRVISILADAIPAAVKATT
ncbi:MAG: aspartate aminotransferase family protein [Chloroflexota bacterium]|nr:MAG: aspartate aminotransferase family protein [Chloroflexota bacterium]